MIPRLLGALVGEDFLRRKREEVEEEYKRLESQIPDAVRKSLQARFPNVDPKELAEQHASLIEAAEQELRTYYAAAKQRKRATLSHLLERSNSDAA
jgi:glycerate-2-kinase